LGWVHRGCAECSKYQTQERSRRSNQTQLKAQTAPPIVTLQHQLAQMSTGTQCLNAPAYWACTPMTFNPPVLSYTSPFPMTSPALFTAPTWGGFGMRETPFSRTQLTRVQIMDKLAMVPQRANSETGVCQYETNVEMWHCTHG
jgi:hypothetical protein